MGVSNLVIKYMILNYFRSFNCKPLGKQIPRTGRGMTVQLPQAPDRPWNDGKDFSTALEMTEGFAPNGWKLCEIGWLPFSEKGRVGTFSWAFRSHPPPTTGGWPRCLWPQVEGQWPSKALPSAEDRRGDAKRPPEIGLLTATVRKPEDRCPAFAGHDDK